jgi:type IV pilus biogenesis protein CpaD/CtpE
VTRGCGGGNTLGLVAALALLAACGSRALRGAADAAIADEPAEPVEVAEANDAPAEPVRVADAGLGPCGAVPVALSTAPERRRVVGA